MGEIRLGPKPPLTVAPDLTVHEVASAMAARNVGAVAVIDHDRLVGIMTERDIVQKTVSRGHDPMGVRVADVMSTPVITIALHTPVADAADIMRRNHIRHLPVVDDGKVVGILAQRYVLYDMLDDLERNAGDLLGYIMADGPGG